MLELFFPENGPFMEKHNDADRGFYESIVIIIPIILVTTMIKLFQRWMRDNERIRELNNVTFKMELNELRNQINPHFLFNMLNGIKSLVRTDPEKASIVIMKLSEFLRYQLYENNDERTLLKSEINFLSNFLDLETLRRDNLSVKIGSNTSSQTINNVFLPPNLFTTFVENAVKHSVDIHGAESFIEINIDIDDDKLIFNCVNSKDPNYKPSSSEKSSGLGLGNIKRRLELLYDDKHTIDIKTTETKYEINLTIPL
jgi:LytS/YehU family sensor histidine kinase